MKYIFGLKDYQYRQKHTAKEGLEFGLGLWCVIQLPLTFLKIFRPIMEPQICWDYISRYWDMAFRKLRIEHLSMKHPWLQLFEHV